MIFIQPIRKNDILPEAGKQIELGKTFMNYHNWETGKIDITLIYNSLTGSDIQFDKKIIQTTLKVRGNERGGDRIGVDCKEYSEGRGTGLGPWKKFFVEDLKITEAKGYFVLEDRSLNGKMFNLYYIPDGASFKLFYERFGNVIDIIKEEDYDYDDYDNLESLKKDNTLSLQQIFYGAPGTGKSHRIKEIIKENSIDEKEQVIRTTFHPDSDYSTFVGCYKPIMKSVPQTYVVEGKEKPVIDMATGKQSEKEEIVYNYTPQAFVQAYTKAWTNLGKPIILVIEEINRGNCAQIFGDIFQLLDRGDDGVSDYEIKPDKALEDYLKGYFAGKNDVPENIRNGEIMKLPANLYIWATMNTSDQSLFPIDSAFKRRWEWKYIKIAKPKEKDWEIADGTNWWAFLQQINAIIGNMTNSADKQLGYFFVKAEDDKTISFDKFVSKVCFYLWNDIFKTYAIDGEEGDLFKFTKKAKEAEENGKEITCRLTFPEFYDEKGEIVEDVVKQFIANVMNWNKEKGNQA